MGCLFLARSAPAPVRVWFPFRLTEENERDWYAFIAALEKNMDRVEMLRTPTWHPGLVDLLGQPMPNTHFLFLSFSTSPVRSFTTERSGSMTFNSIPSSPTTEQIVDFLHRAPNLTHLYLSHGNSQLKVSICVEVLRLMPFLQELGLIHMQLTGMPQTSQSRETSPTTLQHLR